MDTREISRRKLLWQGSAALAGLALVRSPWIAEAFPSRPGEEAIPWLDQPPANPSGGVVENLPRGGELSSWGTPNDKFFNMAHYNKPVIDENYCTLEITGLVRQPTTYTLRHTKARPRQENL